MKLARYTHDGVTTIGAVDGDRVVALKALDPSAPDSIREVMASGPALLSRLEQMLRDVKGGVSLRLVKLEAPIPDAQKYLAIGMNYQDHADEAARAGITVPPHQLWFNKQVSCITGPFDPILKPHVSDKMDYEAEMGVVIGKRCRYVSVEDAPSVVGGYFVANDVTARDWQFKSPTFTLGKSFDTHGPIGPWITTANDIVDPHALQMKLWVNGELRQSASTGGMIYNIWDQIHELSQVMTLEPGDLIATGTCANVGIALGKFLQPGDVVKVEIEGLGHIENTVAAEPA
ncbi:MULTISPECIES: fumarylacetoacetate hydrolase family protein [Burkholderia]|uniref:fumarylacetoacetate hydrolase family protein n=1 Tax=Burkholderia TaxID=32008 RepID=UPI00119A3A80|nr:MULTISPECIES: fumarylacetoacetate hydrolase family protein [Burkholderia]MDN7742012.1 fumarylacetoacetate hydrolase family protein [Burkholderia gladioli]TWC62151.1 2-keto-4-pentenoate hydratase/2-oxohepta-3-ene-1,7-dioic acid hydratase in catechol pathway [Burkholderia sp. SJZ089]TWC95536.1 2-keto-4-pentenoate hydratase/2-oxohepta-3-ene-1,7-dioic acid hydratase in catechol pathway [Burkholderia sp. SJZ115]TWC98888.1 2-keto-4-pentenoate hydratase/2-oxohepta-3-ene-1,7-dioic acid hydratase in 